MRTSGETVDFDLLKININPARPVGRAEFRVKTFENQHENGRRSALRCALFMIIWSGSRFRRRNVGLYRRFILFKLAAVAADTLSGARRRGGLMPTASSARGHGPKYALIATTSSSVKSPLRAYLPSPCAASDCCFSRRRAMQAFLSYDNVIPVLSDFGPILNPA